MPLPLRMHLHFQLMPKLPSRILCLILALLGASVPAWAHGELSQKIARFSWKLSQDPGNPELLVSRGELHRLASHWDEALADYAAADRARPALRPVLEACRAQLELDRGDPVAALEATERALPDHPAPGSVLLLRATALEQLGRDLPAAACYRAGLLAIADPQPEDVHATAEALSRLPRIGNRLALACVEWGLQRIGPCATLELAAVELEATVGRVDDALERLDRLRLASPRQESWWIRRGELLERARRNDDALESYRAARLAIRSLPPHVASRPMIGELAATCELAVERLSQESHP